jgi:hypothetical protein
MEVNKNRWDQAVGSSYITMDGRTVMITAYSVRVSELGSRFICEDVHGALTTEIVGDKPEPIKDHGQWKRLMFDPNGTHKGGDLMATPGLDLIIAVRGAAR